MTKFIDAIPFTITHDFVVGGGGDDAVVVTWLVCFPRI